MTAIGLAGTGLANPMTGAGDTITGGTGGTPQRLAAGSVGQYLEVTSTGVLGWGPGGTGLTNPMTTANDLVVGGSGGTPARLAGPATSGYALQLLMNGSLGWGPQLGEPVYGPSTAHPTVFTTSTQDLLVLPQSYYGLTGDDSAYANYALSNVPTYTDPNNVNYALGRVLLAPGRFTVSSGIATSAAYPMWIVGAGIGATLIQFTGSGDCISMYQNYSPGGGGAAGIKAWGGGVTGLTIDGSGHASGASSGLHIGDMKYGMADVAFQNWSGTGDIALWLDNRAFWTEDCAFKAHFLNCGGPNAVQMDATGALSGGPAGQVHDNCSHEFSYAIYGSSNQVALALVNGANPYHSKFTLHGGIRSTSGANTSAVFFLGQTAPGTTAPAPTFTHCQFDVRMESDGSGTGGITVMMEAPGGGDASPVFAGCSGYMDFMSSSGTWQAAQLNGNRFAFTGFINGDNTLQYAYATLAVPASGGTKMNNYQSLGAVVAANGASGITITVNGYPSAGIPLASTGTVGITIPMGAQVSFGTYSGGTPTWSLYPLNPGE